MGFLALTGCAVSPGIVWLSQMWLSGKGVDIWVISRWRSSWPWKTWRCYEAWLCGLQICKAAILWYNLSWLSGTSGIFVDFFMDCSISRIVSRLGTSESHWIWRLRFLQSKKRRAHLQIFWCVFVFTWCVHWVGTESDWMVIYGMSYHGEPPFFRTIFDVFQLWTCISESQGPPPKSPMQLKHCKETHGFEGILPGRPISGKKAAQFDHEGLWAADVLFLDVSFVQGGRTNMHFPGMLKSWKNRNSKISKSSLHFLFGVWGSWSFQVARYWD